MHFWVKNDIQWDKSSASKWRLYPKSPASQIFILEKRPVVSNVPPLEFDLILGSGF